MSGTLQGWSTAKETMEGAFYKREGAILIGVNTFRALLLHVVTSLRHNYQIRVVAENMKYITTT